MKIQITFLVLLTVSVCHAADKKLPTVDFASFSWEQTSNSTSDATQSESKIKSALLSNGFAVTETPKGNNFILPTQEESGVRIVTWYSSIKNPELKVAVIHEELHVGYAFFVVPSNPTSLEVIWTPYTKVLETIKEQSR